MRLTVFPVSESPVNLMIQSESGEGRAAGVGRVGRGWLSRDDTHGGYRFVVRAGCLLVFPSR